MNEEAEKEYRANPREFVEKWEKTQKLKLRPKNAKRWRPRTTANYTRSAPIRSLCGASPRRYARMKNREKN